MHVTVCPGCCSSCDVMTTPIPYCWGKCTDMRLKDHMVTPLSLVEGGEMGRGMEGGEMGREMEGVR